MKRELFMIVCIESSFFLCKFLYCCFTRCARISLVTKPSVFRNFLRLLFLEITVCSVFLECPILIPFFALLTILATRLKFPRIHPGASGDNSWSNRIFVIKKYEEIVDNRTFAAFFRLRLKNRSQEWLHRRHFNSCWTSRALQWKPSWNSSFHILVRKTLQECWH